VTNIYLESHGVIAPGILSVQDIPKAISRPVSAHAADWFEASRSARAARQRYWSDSARYAFAAAACCTAGPADRPDRLAICLGTSVADYAARDDMDRTVLTDGGDALNAVSTPSFSANMAATRVAVALQARAFCSTFTSPFLSGFEALWFGIHAIGAGHADNVIAISTEEALPIAAGDDVLPGAVALRLAIDESAGPNRRLATLCWGRAASPRDLGRRLLQGLGQFSATASPTVMVVANAHDEVAEPLVLALPQVLGTNVEMSRCTGPGALAPMLSALPALLSDAPVLLIAVHERRFLAFVCGRL